MARRLLDKDEIAEVFRRLRELDPHPRTELLFGSPFQLLIAVILSAQSTDIGVNRATRRLFTDAPTAAAMRDSLPSYPPAAEAPPRVGPWPTCSSAM